MKKAVLLDWDGVLCDSISLYLDLYTEACRRHGKSLPIDGIEAFKGWYNPRWEENYYDMGFSKEEFHNVLEFSEAYLDYTRTVLYPGVEGLLESLARDWPVAIVSTTPSHMIKTRLAAEGLDRHFSYFTGGEDGCSDKMDKIANTLRELGCSQGVMVGDTPLDVNCGRANGLATVGVTYGWVTPQRVIDAHPDRLVEEPGGLETAIRELMA
jgi:phosphoglycolate phosphatase